MVLSETRGLQLCWIMRGGIGSAWRLGAEAHKSPNFWLDTLPRSERLKRNPTATAKDDPQGMERTLGPRRSSCLRFQLFRVEMCSFLPDDERDRCNLSRQGEASHRWLHAFREQALVEVVERSLPAAGHTRRTLEDRFHLMIVILIEPTQLLWFLGTLQLSSHVMVLRAVVRLNRETAVGPQLPLGAKTMRGLDQRDEQCGSDRADRRNLAQ